MHRIPSSLPDSSLDVLLAAVAVTVVVGLGARYRAGSDTPDAEKLSLWSGQAPVGDGKFEAANASITVHRPAPRRPMGRPW